MTSAQEKQDVRQDVRQYDSPPATAEIIVAQPSSIERSSRSRRHHRLGVLIVGIVLAAVVGGLLIARSFRSTAPAFETARVQRGSIQAFVTATGNLNPVVNVQVGSQVSGNIQALYADFNTKVHKGQLIAQIDPAIFQAQVDAGKGVVSERQANVAVVRSQLAKARADLASSRATRDSLAAAEAKDRATYQNLLEQWRRSDGLFRSGIVSPQDHDSARSAFQAAQAQLHADEAQIIAGSRNVESAEAQVQAALSQQAAAEAQLRQAQANLNQAQVNLDHTRILAPVSGTVIALRCRADRCGVVPEPRPLRYWRGSDQDAGRYECR